LQPGGYTLMVRGKWQGHEGDWEGLVDLGAGRAIDMPLTRPRYLRLR